MHTGIYQSGVYYRPGRAAALYLKGELDGKGRTTLYSRLRLLGYLDGDNNPTQMGKDIGIINYCSPQIPEWVKQGGTPYFSDDAIERIRAELKY